MGEEPLADYAAAGHTQAYRVLVVLRPYNSPVVVRLSVRADGAGEVVAKVGRDGGRPQLLTVNNTTQASRADLDKFLRLLDRADFWSMAALDPVDTRHVPMGQEDWMIEGSTNGRYHTVDRSVSELGALKDAAAFLVINLAKLDLRSVPVGPQAGR